ncbi:hypothetical protein PENSPDRAFT_749031 [Peniophora sp. CONT]|nr:hypothetical protein PENSPDRAFT_749031 [Peniophora sp. CONT]
MATMVPSQLVDYRPDVTELAELLVNNPKDVIDRLYRLRDALFGRSNGPITEDSDVEYVELVSGVFHSFMPENIADDKDLLPAVDAGIIEFCVDTILNDRYFLEHKRVQHPHLWCLAALAGRSEQESSQRVAKRLLKIAPSLFECIWRHRSRLQLEESGIFKDPLAGLVSFYLKVYQSVTNTIAPLNSYLFHVQLFLWLASREENVGPALNLSYDFMSRFLCVATGSAKQTGSMPTSLDRELCNTFIRECIIEGVGIDRFLSCYEEQLSRLASGELLPSEHTLSVGYLNPLFNSKLLLPALANRRDILRCGIEALKTMMKAGAENAIVSAWTWCMGAYGDITKYIRDGYSNTSGIPVPHLVSMQPEAVDLFACSVRLAASSQGSGRFILDAPALACLNRELADWFYIHCDKFPRGHPLALNASTVAGLRKVARLQWWPSLRQLQTVCQTPRVNAGLSRLLTLWSNFGRVLGLDAEKERIRHEREARLHCSWVDCQYHLENVPATLLTCKGCGDARYCGRDCQKLDWKHGGHKQACRRLK